MTGKGIVGLARRNAIGLIALFVALGGVAYAATAPKNSVVSKSIKNGQVKSADIATVARRPATSPRAA